MHNLSTADVDAIVRELLKDRFSEVRVDSVDVEEDFDIDGDPILRVIVSYEPVSDLKNISIFSGLLRSLRPALHDKGEERFPVMSFIRSKENEGLAGAA